VNGSAVAVLNLAVVSFAVLVVVACEPHEPVRRRGRHQREHAVSASTATPRVLVSELTDAQTKRTHLVTEQAFAAGCRTGRYQAICDDEVLAASLTTPGVGYCEACVALWRAAR
jgi:hypothetical protein